MAQTLATYRNPKSNRQLADERAAQRRVEKERERLANRTPPAPSVSWMDRGACVGLDPDLFDVATGPRGEAFDVATGLQSAALAVCRSCPVLRNCRSHAENLRPVGMVMGGKVWE
jgi:hypothetical protein